MAGSKDSTGSDQGAGLKSGRCSRQGSSWFDRNRRDIRFLIIFVSCMAAYYLVTMTAPVRNSFFPAYLRFNADLSGRILRILGEDVAVSGQTISSSGGQSIEIERGCDGIAPTALFVAAVLASPVAFRLKVPAAIVGTLALIVLNLVRVVSLFWVRIYYPQYFSAMHLDVWQVLFIFAAIFLWGAWAVRATRQSKRHPNVST